MANRSLQFFLSFHIKAKQSRRTLGPLDLEWWFNQNSTAWNEPTFNPGGVAAEGLRPDRLLRVKFAVFVDTSYPTIQKQINNGFKQAESKNHSA